MQKSSFPLLHGEAAAGCTKGRNGSASRTGLPWRRGWDSIRGANCAPWSVAALTCHRHVIQYSSSFESLPTDKRPEVQSLRLDFRPLVRPEGFPARLRVRPACGTAAAPLLAENMPPACFLNARTLSGSNPSGISEKGTVQLYEPCRPLFVSFAQFRCRLRRERLSEK